MAVVALNPQPATGQRMQGRATLRFRRIRERTHLIMEAQQPPLQVIRAFPLDDGATLAHLHNISGGVLGGDDLATEIWVEAQAQAQITTTGATRIYRSPAMRPAIQRTQVAIQPGGLLEYLPDPTIPFAGAVYEQSSRIDLANGAGVCWWELLAPGREAHGERFDYTRLSLKLDIWAAGRPIAMERAILEPAHQALTSSAYFSLYGHLATCYICKVGVEAQRWEALENRLAALSQSLSTPGRTIWGVSRLAAHGIVVRGLSTGSRDLSGHLMDFWASAKQELYGRLPNIPRKMY